jgi:sugar phosphate isomerase/epimerase
MNPIHSLSTGVISRRRFIGRVGVAAAGAVLGSELAGCATKTASAKIPLGVQLFSVRAECKADFPAAIAAMGKIGFKGVEFAGYWGRSAAELRKILDDNGVVACGSHTPYDTILPDKLEATIEFNRILGNKFLIVPSMNNRTRADWLAKADQFNALADQLAPHGMWIGYHAHQQDFTPVDGETGWDTFFGHTKAAVIMQLDTGNCREGGADPVAVLNKYPGRVRSIHIKPFGGGPEAILGEDTINWPAVFEFCETRGGTKWYVVEHETSKHPVATLQRTFDALKAMGKV